MEISKDTIIFWAILEYDLKTKVQDYIKNAFSFRGYGKAFVFQDITEEDIRLVQEYISNELPGHLEAALKENQLTYGLQEKICFYGSYVSVPNKFCFAPGERLMISKMAQHVKEMVVKQGLKHYADASIVPKKNLNEINMIQSVFGLVYGTQVKRKIEKGNDLVIDTTHQQKVLFEKANSVFTQYQKKKLQPTQAFTVNMVQINKEGDKIKGKVTCIFCEGKNSLSVFCKSSGNWVLTNLSTHIKSMHVKDDDDELSGRCQRLAMEEVPDTNSADSNDSKESIGNENNSTEDSTCEDALFLQISAQCIKMENSVAHNNDKTLQKCFDLKPAKSRATRTAKYCRIAGDGNCFFSATAHQLFNVKVGSCDHKQKTLDLRKEVVSYIKHDEHFPNFIHNLKNRISCDKATNQSDITLACKEFLDNKLSMPGCWAGNESFQAISEMQKVNIIVMNEDGSCNLPNYFNVDANKALLLLFGSANGKSCKSNEERNHFDSIIHISQQKIDSIAKSLNEAEKQHNEFLKKTKSSNIVELD